MRTDADERRSFACCVRRSSAARLAARLFISSSLSPYISLLFLFWTDTGGCSRWPSSGMLGWPQKWFRCRRSFAGCVKTKRRLRRTRAYAWVVLAYKCSLLKHWTSTASGASIAFHYLINMNLYIYIYK